MNSLAIMVAPNGARKMPSDHPNLPIANAAIAADVATCWNAGAQAVHLHVRAEDGRHSLDPAILSGAIGDIRALAGDEMVIQITTESVGRYRPREQMDAVHSVMPEAVSLAVKEIVPDASARGAASEFYAWMAANNIAFQHIIYSRADLELFFALLDDQVIPWGHHSLLFVLGRYDAEAPTDARELIPLVARLHDDGGAEQFDWWVCAFGRAETTCLVAAAALGGSCRVGFENSFFNANGSIAFRNAERVVDLRNALVGIRRRPATRAETLRALGGRPG